MLESGHRSLVTLSQVGVANIDPNVISGDITWKIIDAGQAKEVVAKEALSRLPSVTDVFGPSPRKLTHQQAQIA